MVVMVVSVLEAVLEVVLDRIPIEEEAERQRAETAVMAEDSVVMVEMVLMSHQMEVEVRLFAVAVVLHSVVLSLSIGVPI